MTSFVPTCTTAVLTLLSPPSQRPSAENLIDGDDRAVLGLVWALMMKYLKFAQEDGENLSPKEALLRWVNLNTAGHPHAEAKDFKKSFHSGLVLCALLHKFRPSLIDYDSLSPEDARQNLQYALHGSLFPSHHMPPPPSPTHPTQLL